MQDQGLDDQGQGQGLELPGRNRGPQGQPRTKAKDNISEQIIKL